MKKITLLVTALFAITTGAIASENSGFLRPVSIADAEPIVFIERGVEFFVFADGQFDFNTRPTTGGDVYYKSAARASVNRTHGAPRVQTANYGVRVEHDELGRVRRVGNVFINYDGFDRIKRIGSVYMSYNRFALSQVGGLRLKYDNRGFITGYSGSVNGRQPMLQNTYGGNNYGNGHGNSNSQSDEDFYYYKTDGTKVKVAAKK